MSDLDSLALNPKYRVYVPGIPELTKKYYSEKYAETVADELRKEQNLMVWVELIPMEFGDGLYGDWTSE